MKKTILFLLSSIFSFNLFAQSSGSFTDHRDGNVYSWIKIGDQIWMAENLRAEVYPDGSNIPLITDNTDWGNLSDNNTSDAYCFPNNNSSSEYGALYTWAAAMGDNAISSTSVPSGIQGVCPDGWHLPSRGEWGQLIEFLANNGFNYDGTSTGIGQEIGKSMASKSGWISSSTFGDVGNNQNTNNSSGFNAFPAGLRNSYVGDFEEIGFETYWWSSSDEDGDDDADGQGLKFDHSGIWWSTIRKSEGQSVRCISDDDIIIEQPTISVAVRPNSWDWSNWSWDYQKFSDAYFVASVGITSTINTENVEIEAKLGDIPMNIILADLDQNLDEKIDIVGAAESTFHIYSNELTNHLQNEPLSIKVTSADDESIDYEYQDIVSMYFLKDDNGEPYSFFRDSYQFSNFDEMTFREFVNELEVNGINLNLSLAGFKYIAVRNGRCFGMAASSGSYFKMPWLRPVSGYPYDWGKYHYEAHHSVISNINSYHLNQVLERANRNFQELGDLFPTIKDEIRNGYPVVLGCHDSHGYSLGHAYLATKVMEYGNQNLKAIQIYENQFSGMKDILLKSDGGIMDGEAVYDEFYQFGREVFEPFDPGVFENRVLEQLLNTVVENENKIFSVACPVHLLVVGNDNRRSGFDEDGIKYNEIEGAEVEKYSTGNGESDYVTYITVPAENECFVQLFAYAEDQITLEYYAPDKTDILTGNLDDFTMYRNTYAILDESKSQLELIIDDNGDWITDRTFPLEIESPVSDKKEATQNFLEIYPNPVEGRLNICCDSDLPFSVIIRSDKGDTMSELKSLTNPIELDVSNYTQGIYFITIRSKDFVTTRKIVKL